MVLPPATPHHQAQRPSRLDSGVSGDINTTTPAQATPPIRPPASQTTTCRFWLAGRCTRGEACWFRHALGEGEGEEQPAVSVPITSIRPRLDASVAEFVPRTSDRDVDTIPSSPPPPSSSTTPAQPASCHASTSSVTLDSPPPPSCDICYEFPATYGLLEKCSHVFCLQCIRQWRAPAIDTRPDLHESGATKKCPACRTQSNYIIPSSTFHGEGEAKDEIVTRYKNILARKPCKHFESTKNSTGGPRCPFGDECHYKHELHNGSGERYMFDGGFAEMQLRAYVRRELDMMRHALEDHRRTSTRGAAPPMPQVDDDTLARSNAVNYFMHPLVRQEQARVVQSSSAVQDNLDAYLRGEMSEDEARSWVAAYRQAQEEGLPVPPTEYELDREAAAGQRWDALDEEDDETVTPAEPVHATIVTSTQPGRITPPISTSSARSQRRRAQRAAQRERGVGRRRPSSSGSEDSTVFIMDPETEGRGGGRRGSSSSSDSGSVDGRGRFAQL